MCDGIGGGLFSSLYSVVPPFGGNFQLFKSKGRETSRETSGKAAQLRAKDASALNVAVSCFTVWRLMEGHSIQHDLNYETAKTWISKHCCRRAVLTYHLLSLYDKWTNDLLLFLFFWFHFCFLQLRVAGEITANGTLRCRWHSKFKSGCTIWIIELSIRSFSALFSTQWAAVENQEVLVTPADCCSH